MTLTLFICRYIIFHVVDYDEDGKNDSLGQVIIDLMNFDPDNGFRSNFELADLVSVAR